MLRIAIFMAGAFAWLSPALLAQSYSALWGKSGEAWDPAGRLPDVSYAGYACGGKPIPKIPIVANVRDFGAKGDGTTDDSAAFISAIEKTPKGAIAIPAGRYRITKIIGISKSGVVLRGAGPEKTILVCPVPLNDILPNWGETTGGKRTSNYSWSGGIVSFNGRNAGRKIGTVDIAAKRGAHELHVKGETTAIRPGSWIEINLRDDDKKSLLEHLYSGDPGDLSKIKPGSHKTVFTTRIKAVNGDLLTTERPLRIDIRPEWNPQVSLYEPTTIGCGIEDIGFEFPERKYGGHFSELGFNAVAFPGAAHCWARNLIITNADSGIFANGRFCTLQDIRLQLRGVKENNGVFGHHGITLSGHDNLCTRFEVHQRFIHDISVENGAGNVASSGSGTDLCFDHHKRAPYENVFTDIDLGAGSRMWKCGGGDALGRQSGARGTFWNIRAKQTQKYPEGFGPPSLNLVAVQPAGESLTKLDGHWFEAIAPDRIQPADLHAAQLKKRLGTK